mgnify:CR=1 FL=1
MTQANEETIHDELTAVVENAIADGTAPERIETILQREAQNVRQTRRVAEVFTFECPVEACRETATKAIDRSALYCDVCEEQLSLFESQILTDSGVKLLKFTCDAHDTVRVHQFPRNKRTCSQHGEQMDLVESHTRRETERYEA